MPVFVWDKTNSPCFANFYGDSMAVVEADDENEAWSILAYQQPEAYLSLQNGRPFHQVDYTSPDLVESEKRLSAAARVKDGTFEKERFEYFRLEALHFRNSLGVKPYSSSASRPKILDKGNAVFSKASD